MATDGERKTVSTGVCALLLTALIGSVMGLFARELATELNVVEQVFLRSLLGASALLAIAWRRIDLGKIPRAPRRDLALAAGRALAFYVVAISLGTVAFVNGAYGPVAIVLALPMPAILSIVLFRERAGGRALALVGLAFAGAALIIGAGPANVAAPAFVLDWPLLCALLASVFMAFGILGQKRQSAHFNNLEITFLMLTVATLAMAAATGVWLAWTGSLPRLSPYILAVGLVSGLANVAYLLAANYGVPRVSGVVVNNVLAVQPVFATAVGILVYGEGLSLIQGVGGGMVLASLVLIARVRATGPAQSGPASTAAPSSTSRSLRAKSVRR